MVDNVGPDIELNGALYRLLTVSAALTDGTEITKDDIDVSLKQLQMLPSLLSSKHLRLCLLNFPS